MAHREDEEEVVRAGEQQASPQASGRQRACVGDLPRVIFVWQSGPQCQSSWHPSGRLDRSLLAFRMSLASILPASLTAFFYSNSAFHSSY